MSADRSSSIGPGTKWVLTMGSKCGSIPRDVAIGRFRATTFRLMGSFLLELLQMRPSHHCR